MYDKAERAEAEYVEAGGGDVEAEEEDGVDGTGIDRLMN
jgi:hypothetical protein